jgi:hypothetical protein
VAGDIEQVVERVDRLSVEVTQGEGTLAQLIRDPSVYQSINDILIGINESRVLRWLIRNRQGAGIDRRYEDAVEAGEVPPLPPGPEPVGDQPPAPLERLPPADETPTDQPPGEPPPGAAPADDEAEPAAQSPAAPPPGRQLTR